jgi:AraC family transcriptional regulator, transcriptional activator of pobA
VLYAQWHRSPAPLTPVHHLYHDRKTNGILTLSIGEPTAERHFFDERKTPLLSIGWNRGPAQTIWIDDAPRSVPGNALVTLMVSQTYRFERPGDVVLWRFNRDFYCIVDHDREVSCVGLLFYGSHGTMVLSPGVDDLRRLGTLLTVFDDEFQTRDTIQGEMLRTLLKRLIILLTRLARNSHIGDALTQPQLDVVRQFNLLVENRYRTLHRVSEYASLMHKSPQTLANLFAAHADRTPLQVIQEHITIEAKRLLIYTDKGVKQIAGELGFADAATFSRFFKSMAGTGPQEFRVARGGIAPAQEHSASGGTSR